MNPPNIEDHVDVHKIQHGGVSIWPVIKSYLPGVSGEFDIIKEATTPHLWILLKNLIPDLFSIRKFRKNRCWVFTNSERRYYINDTSFDRITTGLLTYLDSYLLFENPIPKGSTRASKLQSGEHSIGMSWIFLLQYLFFKVAPERDIKNFEILEDFLGKGLSKLRRIYGRILGGARVYSILFRIFRPKVIFVVCYYSNFEILLAAKKHAVPVVELQHGLVTETHRAYFYNEWQPSVFMPDYFLSYGSDSSEIISRGKVVPKERILDYGYSFLEAVNQKLTMSASLSELKQKYVRTICITGQLEVTDIPLLQMIDRIAGFFPETCFIFKPRFSHQQASFQGRENFISLEGHNTYELLKYCDYHLTVYSTCALESLALGTPNIAVDIKGYYSKFLKRLLESNPYNYVAGSEEDLRIILENLGNEPDDAGKVKASIAHIFSPLAGRASFLRFFKGIF